MGDTVSKKILMITPVFPPYHGGMARVAEQYASWAHQAGHIVHVITPLYDTAVRNSRVFEYRVTRIRSLLRYGNAAWILKYPVSYDVDIIHFHYPFIGGINALCNLIKKNPSAKVVITYHMDLVSNGFKGFVFALWRFCTLGRLLKHASVIHVTSHDYAASSHLQKYMNVEKTVAIPLSIATNIWSNFVRNDVRQNLGLVHDKPFVVMVAALDQAHQFKGIEQAIHVMKQYNEVRPELHLYVIGDGDMRKYYENIADNLGIASYVHFVGSVSDKELGCWLNESLALLMLSTGRSEAFGIVILEALACGTPVIAHAIPGVRTLISEGINGFLIEQNSLLECVKAIQKLHCMQSDEYQTLRQTTKESAVIFDDALIAPRIMALYT